MIKLHGISGNYMLFTDDNNAVVIDSDMNMVDQIGKIADLSYIRPWEKSLDTPNAVHLDLAHGALADLQVHAVTASGRMYTIPKVAQEEAKKALEWRKEHGRGGTPVGLNTARILANGGQIGLKKIRHIAKYFPRHEVDKKAKGYKPGEDNFPSNGRIAWALWGGDAAWKWARQIVERENAKAISAGGYYEEDDYGYDPVERYSANVNPFKEAFELGDEGPEFVARVRMDGSGFDRLYVIDQSGQVKVWDDGEWDDLGHVDSDIMTYDRSLDDPYDTVEKAHMFIDADTALIISAHLQEKPFQNVTVYDIDPEEAAFMESTLDDVDWEFVDSTLVAATGVNPEDGVYSPEERAESASKQVRDITGKFAKMGSRVVVGGDTNKRGSIVALNPQSKSVSVKLDSGETVNVGGTATQAEAGFDAKQVAPARQSTGIENPLDTSGILGQPRTPARSPLGRVPGTLPPLNNEQLRSVLYNFPAWVKSQRDSFKKQKPVTPLPRPPASQIKSDYIAERAAQTGISLWEGDYREHPMIGDLFKKNPIYNLYYNPLYAAGEPQTALANEDKPSTVKELIETAPQGIGEPLTPNTSDVQPMYLAIVSPDDPSAVFDLIAVVPKGENSTAPSVFKRVDKDWKSAPEILADLVSMTPPPVVPLHGEAYKDVLDQVDGSGMRAAAYEFAQGGIDRNRGNAERLRRYWVYGKGAAKIRWGAPGDWSRCVRQLAKYMGPRAKGYCNLRHKDALGIWPATHAKLIRGGRRNSINDFVLTEPVYDIFGRAKGKPKTVITADDLKMSLEEIASLEDDMFDSNWEPEDEILILLSDPEIFDVELEPLTAALEGGLDRNRGNAERLRRYWLYGKGALKIRWNTPGDWTRCYRNLSKYMGVRAKGYCSLRHKEATGFWPGSKYNVGKRNINASAFDRYDFIDEDVLFEKLFLSATMQHSRDRVLLAGGYYEGGGCKFRIPLVIPESIESGDGRKFDKGSIEYRELPLPLLWQIKTADGHNGSVVVGRIDHMERTDQGIGNAYGVFDSGAHGREAERMVREGFIRGVSADLDQFEASEEDIEDKVGAAKNKKEKTKIGGSKINISHARVMAVTIVPKPAFQECSIYIDETANAGDSQEDIMSQAPDGIYVEDDISPIDATAIIACGAIAASIPVVPPATWFTNPQLNKPTPLTVDDNGRVFGHIAAWHVNHIGMTAGTRPPRSKSKYSYFHTGVVRADDGKDYKVGQLTLAGGHASLHDDALSAAKHYDDTGSAIADVQAGEDAHGIWVAGALRSNATPEQIRALRASAPSGDWRPINGALELVAVCQVNVPGFPIARARVASGQVYALVAAGAAVLAKMKSDPLSELTARMEDLEKKQNAHLTLQINELRDRMADAKSDHRATLAAKAEELATRVYSSAGYDELGYMPRQLRERLAKEGKALPDGSYPIRDVDELRAAISGYGRSKPGKRAAVRRHIMKRARSLGKYELVPEKWKSASIVDEEIPDLKARVASAQGLLAMGKIIAEEQELADALISITEKYGKFNEDDTGVWAGYTPADKNENADIGVNCANCILYAGGTTCKILSMEVEPMGSCRFALIPDGVVGKKETVTAAADAEDTTNPKAVSGGRKKYVSGVDQPRDIKGKFRTVLARLKQDLGVSGLQNVVEKVEEVENLDNAGNYAQAAASAQELLKLVGRIDAGALNATSLENIRESTRLLGNIMSNLPLPFGSEAQKVKFSDLPPVLRNLIDDMVDRVEKKIGKKDADIATEKLRKYKAGGDSFSQGEVSEEMNVMLRLLT